MSRRNFNMVSEHYLPLMANVITSNLSNQHTTDPGSANGKGKDSNKSSTVFFNHSLSMKLNNHNFLLWKQQVMAAIRGNILLHYIQAGQIWRTLEKYFTLQVSAKILEFRTKLQNIKKGNLGLNEYLLRIKQHVDLLASVGEVLSASDHSGAIFEELPSKYDTFVISTNIRIEGYSVAEIKALLLASESQIEKTDTKFDLSAHVTTNEADIHPEANYTNSRSFRQYQQGNHNQFHTPRGNYNGPFNRNNFAQGVHS
uniref:Retrotransposon Copia-like N-terminal domain-containing protein n=1 Tax=Cannabis sativa TaxID=3483 RepID=A0A803NU32_CANSA